jgi:FkbM family methyltransferase
MNVWMIKARSLARRTGLTRLIQRFSAARPYEDRFRDGLERAMRPGDTVWDVGANVGLYTEHFALRVGPEGSVVAFEPMPESAERVRLRIAALPWAHVENLALGAENTVGNLVLTGESTTHHVASSAEKANAGAECLAIEIARGDTVRDRLGRTPNVIKIDVEGFELEVLRGLEHTLSLPELRAVLVEVHFRQLEERGQAEAPVEIEKLLKSKKFCITWLDASHLQASRPEQR